MSKLSYALSSEQVELDTVTDGGFAFLRDAQGFLNCEEMEAVIGLLSNTLALMRAEDLNQVDVLAKCVQDTNQIGLAAKNWIVPVIEKHTRSKGSCIYFIYSPQTDLIKIGHTNDLSHRTWGISRSSGDDRGDLQILAVIKCEDPRPLEYYIHTLLESSRIHLEWFSCQGVLDFIAQHSGVVVVTT